MGVVKLKVLRSSHEIRFAGKALSNCANSNYYCGAVASENFMLVAMYSSNEKVLALGQLDPRDMSRWHQLSGPSNSPSTPEMRTAFNLARSALEAWRTTQDMGVRQIAQIKTMVAELEQGLLETHDYSRLRSA